MKGTVIFSTLGRRSVVFCAAVFLGLSCQTWAQIDVGAVVGTVTDPTGAVVPRARLTLTNQATGIVQGITSSSRGTYVFQAVPPGVYTLKAESSGFKTYVKTEIEVHVQHTLTADIPLVVGNLNEVVTVSSEAPLLQAEEASVGRTVGSRAVNDLPLTERRA